MISRKAMRFLETRADLHKHIEMMWWLVDRGDWHGAMLSQFRFLLAQDELMRLKTTMTPQDLEDTNNAWSIAMGWTP